MALNAELENVNGFTSLEANEWASEPCKRTSERRRSPDSWKSGYTMILLPFKCIHPNEMKFSVFSEWRVRGCYPTSHFRKEWKINHCSTYCTKEKKLFTDAVCLCDGDLCNAHKKAPYKKPDCSKTDGEITITPQMSMAMEAPHDEVQWKWIWEHKTRTWR